MGHHISLKGQILNILVFAVHKISVATTGSIIVPQKHPQIIYKQTQLCSNKTLFTKTDIRADLAPGLHFACQYT